MRRFATPTTSARVVVGADFEAEVIQKKALENVDKRGIRVDQNMLDSVLPELAATVPADELNDLKRVGSFDTADVAQLRATRSKNLAKKYGVCAILVCASLNKSLISCACSFLSGE